MDNKKKKTKKRKEKKGGKGKWLQRPHLNSMVGDTGVQQNVRAAQGTGRSVIQCLPFVVSRASSDVFDVCPSRSVSAFGIVVAPLV
jgi:hypothetical protein